VSIKTIQLGKLVKVVGGYAFKSEDFSSEGFSVIRISDIQNGNVEINATAKIPVERIGKGSQYKVGKGDILIAMSGATTGKIGIVPENISTEVYQNQRVGNFKVLDDKLLNKSYLKHFLCSPSYQAQIWKTVVGVAQPNISSSQLESFQIPLPETLEEQKRIAAVLDKADEVRAKRRVAITKLDSLLQSVFLDMFGDPVSNPKGWESGSIELVVKNKSDVRCGPFGTQLKVDELVDSGIPLYGIENVRDNKFNPKVSKFLTENKAEQLNAFDVKPKDVLITRMGTIGKACVVPANIGKARFSYHLFRVRPDIQRCLPKFLTATINRSGTFQNQLKNVAHGAIMAGLNTTNLKQVKFLLPPISNQHKYVEIVDKIEEEKVKFELGLSQTEKLFQSLQQRAFAGELFGAELSKTVENVN